MIIGRLSRSLLFGAATLVAICNEAAAREIDVSVGENVQAAIDNAEPGDVVRLGEGRHVGSLVINKAIELTGVPGAIVDGAGQGKAILVDAPGAVVRGLEVRGSGEDLPNLDSGIFVSKNATGARVENNKLVDNLFGIYLHGAVDSVASGNEVIGRRDVRMTQTGSGISIWNAPGAKIIGNVIRYGRDGIYTTASRKNVFRDNVMENVRFAVHYMYTDDSEVIGNVSRNNSVGFAIMYTNRLKVQNNLSDGDRDHGLLLNYANSSVISGNRVIGRMQPIDRWLDAGLQKGEHGVPAGEEVQAGETARLASEKLGPEKCVFIYNANKNKFTDNSFENCSIGIHFTAGSEGNAMSGNAFINNRNQVKYVGTRNLEWSVKGKGNYWSDNPGFDLNGDGIADSPYRPNDLIDRVLWTAPQAKILINSPAVETIRWAQTQFPALLPGGVTDSFPLMKPPVMNDKGKENG